MLVPAVTRPSISDPLCIRYRQCKVIRGRSSIAGADKACDPLDATVPHNLHQALRESDSPWGVPLGWFC